jgi:antitoxin (DNA-binding transcriptional repressor) of toxin-antitoxin stability system
MENIIALKDLRLNMEKYVAEVKTGKSFIVLKQSKPIFKLSPVNEKNSDEDNRWDEIINFTKIKKGGVDIDSLLAAL